MSIFFLASNYETDENGKVKRVCDYTKETPQQRTWQRHAGKAFVRTYTHETENTFAMTNVDIHGLLASYKQANDAECVKVVKRISETVCEVVYINYYYTNVLFPYGGALAEGPRHKYVLDLVRETWNKRTGKTMVKIIDRKACNSWSHYSPTPWE